MTGAWCFYLTLKRKRINVEIERCIVVMMCILHATLSGQLLYGIVQQFNWFDSRHKHTHIYASVRRVGHKKTT